MSKGGVMKFIRVGFAYGCNAVSALNRALKEIDTAFVFYVSACFRWESEDITQDSEVVFTLILYVVNCENGFKIIAVYACVVNRHKRGLPVICVNNIRHKSGKKEAVHNSLAEKGVSLTVIIISVETVSVEIIFVIDKIICYVILYELKESAVEISPRETYVEIADIFCFISVLIADVAVVRHDNPYVVIPTGGKGLRKASDYFSESACSREWKALAAYK